MTVFFVDIAPEAYADLDEMYIYIADHGFPNNAFAFTQRVFNFCQTLAMAPHRGVRRFDLHPGLRIISFQGQVEVCFQVLEEEQRIYVLRILGRGQSLEKAFAAR